MLTHITFTSGENTLEGMLSTPEGGAERYAIVCHPHPLYGGNMENNVVSAVFDRLADQGFGVLKFNFRGVGQSTGSFDEGVVEGEDVGGGVQALCDKFDLRGCDIDVVGYSFGAWVALGALAEDERVRSFVSIAPPVSFLDMGEAGISGKPKYFIHGTRDDYCEVVDFSRWYETLPEPKQEETIELANHFFIGFEKRVAELVSCYLKSLD